MRRYRRAACASPRCGMVCFGAKTRRRRALRLIRREDAIIADQRLILDNLTPDRAVAEYLRRALSDADCLRAASGYFSIYGYELLADKLKALDDARILFGMPSSAAALDPSMDPKAYDLTERGELEPAETLAQKGIALDCKAWAERDGVQFRSAAPSKLLHGKMYLAGNDGVPRAGVVGSSNFTKRGLGGGGAANWELNLAADDPDALSDLRDWFDKLWNDENLTVDVKRDVLDALDRIGKNYAPEAVYMKTLYEVFREDFDAMPNPDSAESGLHGSAIWAFLREFQKDGALTAIAKLNRLNGCLLSDSVGLGKTFTALAVIKHFESVNERVLVICPRRLVSTWQAFQVNRGSSRFAGDRFGYTLMAHTDLGRERGMSSTNIRLDNFNWGGYGLIVIDESHNFRNADGKRYKWLMDKAIKAGARTKVMMLSATPLNTSLLDLQSQISLMAEGRGGAFAQSLGINDLGAAMKDAEARFAAWLKSGERGEAAKAALLSKLGRDFTSVMTAVSIARSRKHIRKTYAEDIRELGSFPERQAPRNIYPKTKRDVSDAASQKFYDGAAKALSGLSLALYNPSAYLAPNAAVPRAQQRRQSEFNLVGMMRVNFLKRLESSAHALSQTIARAIAKIDAELASIDAYGRGERQGAAAAAAMASAAMAAGALESAAADVADDGDEELAAALDGADARHPYAQMDIPKWRAALQADKDALAALHSEVAGVRGDSDGKLVQFKRDILSRMRSPSIDSGGKPSRKLLAFTTFKDTAVYLYEQLKDAPELGGVGVAMVSGDETRAASGPGGFDNILDRFAPDARAHTLIDGDDGVDLLIATDCVSEGQNLQDCDAVLNYDIHWNPVRLIQRFGRIDRIGSRHSSVKMTNYWPPEPMEKHLNLEARVQARMALADIAATGHDDILDESAYNEAAARADEEANYRTEQLALIRESIPDLEDILDKPAMSDLSMQAFIDQLRHYLRRNERFLQEMPYGVYAVSDHAGAGGGQDDRPCVIFCFKRRGKPDERVKSASAAPPPFYLACVYADDKSVRYGCGDAANILQLFSDAAMGKTEPLLRLCDRIDSETKQGSAMGEYSAMARSAIDDALAKEAAAEMAGIGAVGGSGGFALSEKPVGGVDYAEFELVTWLIIREPLNVGESAGGGATDDAAPQNHDATPQNHNASDAPRTDDATPQNHNANAAPQNHNADATPQNHNANDAPPQNGATSATNRQPALSQQPRLAL